MKHIDKSLIILIIILCTPYIFSIIGINISIPCIIYKITNLYCPGCGLTRMIKSLLNGEVYQAFRFNPLAFLLLILGIIMLIFDKLYLKYSKHDVKIPTCIYKILIALVLLYGILRNIPFFSFLKPTIVK